MGLIAAILIICFVVVMFTLREYARSAMNRRSFGPVATYGLVGLFVAAYIGGAYTAVVEWGSQDSAVLVVALIVSPVLVFLWLASRRNALEDRRRIRHGLCRYCGYNLRGTPYQCPECGSLTIYGRRELDRSSHVHFAPNDANRTEDTKSSTTGGDGSPPH